MIAKINFQPISKAEVSDGSKLLVKDIWFTIQGEGPNVGKPAVFLRLGGCNLQCPGCDTEYTVGSAYEGIDSIITRIRMAFGDYAGEHLVVITGGEPFRQNLGPLIDRIYSTTYWNIQVESNGTLGFEPLRRFMSHRFSIVASPKAGKVHPSLYPFITAYKYVLDIVNIDPRDGLPTSVLGLPAAPARPHAGFDGDIYVQPADERDSENNEWNLAACVDIAKRFGYRVGIQTHKLMGVE